MQLTDDQIPRDMHDASFGFAADVGISRCFLGAILNWRGIILCVSLLNVLVVGFWVVGMGVVWRFSGG